MAKASMCSCVFVCVHLRTKSKQAGNLPKREQFGVVVLVVVQLIPDFLLLHKN